MIRVRGRLFAAPHFGRNLALSGHSVVLGGVRFRGKADIELTHLDVR
jgi:hypothetical protein